MQKIHLTADERRAELQPVWCKRRRKDFIRTMSVLPRLLGPALALLLANAGCDGPCTNLAEQICSCEPNQTREQACLVNVELSIRNAQTDEQTRCEELLRTCTCASIDRGDFESCGLTQSAE
ncbi:MAG: hypothetical protein AAF449_23365 [Myxococcota bacterium]